MKKFILSLLVVVVTATEASSQIAICPEAGLYMANITLKTDSKLISTSLKKSFTIGGFLDHGFSDHIYLQPGLFYVMNGCNVIDVGWYKINTIQVPVNVSYRSGVPGGHRFFIGAGPYFGYNISGLSKIDGISSALKIGSDKNKDDIKAMDFGLGLNVGLILSNNFYFRVLYQVGLNNINPGGDSANSAKTSGISFTVGYSFGHSRPVKKNKIVHKA